MLALTSHYQMPPATFEQSIQYQFLMAAHNSLYTTQCILNIFAHIIRGGLAFRTERCQSGVKAEQR